MLIVDSSIISVNVLLQTSCRFKCHPLFRVASLQIVFFFRFQNEHLLGRKRKNIAPIVFAFFSARSFNEFCLQFLLPSSVLSMAIFEARYSVLNFNLPITTTDEILKCFYFKRVTSSIIFYSR